MDTELLWKNFERQFPYVAAQVCEYHADNSIELVVGLDNGERYVYDDTWQSIRQIPSSPLNLTENEFKREFGVRLRKLMERYGVTQLDLSERTGINNVTICRYLSGRSVPSFYAIDKIAKAIGCSTDDFRYV